MSNRYKTKEQKAAKREADKRYRQSEKGKARTREALQRYRQTEQGKAKHSEDQNKYYNATGKTAACIRRDVYRKRLNNIKTHYGCMNPDCKVNWPLDPCCLDFHHVDASRKSFNIGGGGGHSIPALVAELRKCTVLCALCHRLNTWGDLDASNFPTCQINDDASPK